MKLKLQNTSYDTSRARGTAMGSSPFSTPLLSRELPVKQELNIKRRPLKTNSMNLSFKGLSFNNVSKVVDDFGKEFGATPRKYFEDAMQKAHATKKSGFTISGDTINIKEDSFGKRVLDVILYPFFNMHLDIANSFLHFLKRNIFKKSKALDGMMNAKALKNRRDKLMNDSNIAAIKEYFKLNEAGKKGFKNGHKRFSTSISNYDSTMERTLTRIVTGLIPAFFLANDAYNLSIYVNNKKDIAKKEKQRRFRQEAARIGITAAATYTVLGIFSKKANASEFATVGLMSGLTFVSEIIGRMITGTPVLPVNVKGAKRYAKIQGKSTDDSAIDKNNPQRISNEYFKGKMEQLDPSQKFEGKDPQMGAYQKPPEKGSLTLPNVLKAIGVLVMAGFGVDKVSNLKKIKPLLESLNKSYKNLYTKQYKISKDDYNAITKKLRENGFDKIADSYDKMIAKQKIDGNNYDIGTQKDKVRYLLVHNILTFPIRFAWDTMMFPYKGIAKPLANAIVENAQKLAGKEIVKAEEAPDADEIMKKEQTMLQDIFGFLKKAGKKEDYQNRVSSTIMGSLDNVTKSNHSNADLSAVIKNTMSAITSLFLIADNYNIVMIDSNGKNKDLAEQKAKERTLQRAVRLLYGAFLVKFLNSACKSFYDANHISAQTVNTFYAFATETLERTSVGMPLAESTREEINKKEKANLEAKGLRGAYYGFMAKLTGKKTFYEMKFN